MEIWDTIVIGGAAAGLTAAMYAARRKMKTLVITKDTGGQSAMATWFENYPGFLHISGPKLMQKFEKNARKSGAEIIFNEITSVKENGKNFVVSTANGDTHEAKSLILTFGKTPRNLEVPGEDRLKGKGVSYCASCLLPDSLIMTNPSVEKIGKLEGGKHVLTHDGTYRQIVAVTNRDYDGEIMKIKPRFFREEVSLTLEHPVLVVTLRKGRGKNYFNFQFSKPFWIKAGELTKEHIVLYPINRMVKDVNSIKINEILKLPNSGGLVKNKRETYTSKRIPSEIMIDKGFLRLAGYYLADGYITGRGITLDFNIQDDKYIYDAIKTVRELFGLKARVKRNGDVVRVSAYSLILQKLFEKLFGKYSYNKSISDFIMFLPPEKQAELIKGIWVGDGSKGPKSFDIVTNSSKLAHQIKNIMLRLGIIPSVSFRSLEQLNKKPSKIGKRLVYFKHGKYNIGVGGVFLKKMSEILGVGHPKLDDANKNSEYAWIIGDYAYLPIRQITKTHYRGKVFNLVVKDNNTYATTGFIVHNCDMPLFFGKTIAIVGGGNSALDAALYGSKGCKKVYLVHRRDQFRGFEYLSDQVVKKSNVEILYNSVVVEIKGENKVESLVVQNNQTNEKRNIDVDGIFVEIGHVVKTDFLKGFVQMNDKGEIIVDLNNATSKPGVYAAGDITQLPFKQTVNAAGDGCKAALAAYNYVNNIPMDKVTPDWK